ncbi:MAG: alpha/beta fold hydrolase [Kofleriaceae bacterium]|nr:alpha/beta fold hydrolase [Kofleriaceae bacterium]
MPILYLHGFASGPQSKKGVEFEAYFARKGVAIQRLNLRVPSFEHLRLSAMIDTVRGAIDHATSLMPVGTRHRTVLIGSSLGGLTAARVAALDERVTAVVLLAPAFQLADRWREALGEAAWNEWYTTGWREVDDYTTGAKSRVDFGFVQDVERVDVGYPDVTVPTLVMHGVHDDVVPIERSRKFVAHRPNARLIELPDGHELVASLPTLLAETEAFLDALP